MPPEMVKSLMDQITARYPNATVAPCDHNEVGIFVDGYWEGRIRWDYGDIEWRVPE